MAELENNILVSKEEERVRIARIIVALITLLGLRETVYKMLR